MKLFKFLIISAVILVSCKKEEPEEKNNDQVISDFSVSMDLTDNLKVSIRDGENGYYINSQNGSLNNYYESRCDLKNDDNSKPQFAIWFSKVFDSKPSQEQLDSMIMLGTYSFTQPQGTEPVTITYKNAKGVSFSSNHPINSNLSFSITSSVKQNGYSKVTGTFECFLINEDGSDTLKVSNGMITGKFGTKY